jgi:endoglucanase
VYSRQTHTDADEFHLARAGVPTGLLSIATRYLHSPNEICDLADVEAIIELIVAFARRLTPDTSFVR